MSKKIESPLDRELHIVCTTANVEKLRNVLDTGRVHVDCQDEEDGTTPLILAIISQHVEVVKVLLSEGADPNLARQNDTSPLMFAAQSGSPVMSEMLLNHGADINATNQDGATALMFACQWGWNEIVDILLTNRHCNIFKAMKDGTTALFLAAQAGFPDIVSLLISTCRRRKASVGILVAAPRRDGASPLFIAAQIGNLKCVKILLANEAEVDQSRIDDVTPLFKACHKGHLEVARELLKHNANPGILLNGETCLHAAAVSGNLKLVNLLLNLGLAKVNPAIKNRNDKTAVDLARENDQEDSARKIEAWQNKVKMKSCINSSSASDSSSPKQGQQHVRFDLKEAGTGRRLRMKSLDREVSKTEKVHCRMLTTEQIKFEKRSPVRIVWRNSMSRVPDKQVLDDHFVMKNSTSLICFE